MSHLFDILQSGLRALCRTEIALVQVSSNLLLVDSGLIFFYFSQIHRDLISVCDTVEHSVFFFFL